MVFLPERKERKGRPVSMFISMPYEVSRSNNETSIKINSLQINISAKTLQQAQEDVRLHIQEWAESEYVTTDNVVFQEDHKSKDSGLLISSLWDVLIIKALEFEPLPEQRDLKTERAKRVEIQEHLDLIK